jgi:2-oxoisovalerate dehydrogenase E1 component beta subunit
LLIACESPKFNSVASSISSYIQEKHIDVLKGPISIIGGWDTPFPLIYEKFYTNIEMRIEQKVQDMINLYY